MEFAFGPKPESFFPSESSTKSFHFAVIRLHSRRRRRRDSIYRLLGFRTSATGGYGSYSRNVTFTDAKRSIEPVADVRNLPTVPSPRTYRKLIYPIRDLGPAWANAVSRPYANSVRCRRRPASSDRAATFTTYPSGNGDGCFVVVVVVGGGDSPYHVSGRYDCRRFSPPRRSFAGPSSPLRRLLNVHAHVHVRRATSAISAPGARRAVSNTNVLPYIGFSYTRGFAHFYYVRRLYRFMRRRTTMYVKYACTGVCHGKRFDVFPIFPPAVHRSDSLYRVMANPFYNVDSATFSSVRWTGVCVCVYVGREGGPKKEAWLLIKFYWRKEKYEPDGGRTKKKK